MEEISKATLEKFIKEEKARDVVRLLAACIRLVELDNEYNRGLDEWPVDKFTHMSQKWQETTREVINETRGLYKSPQKFEDFEYPFVDPNKDSYPEDIKPTEAPHTRGSLLDEAKAVINGERQDQYGSPENSFQLIADYWGTYIHQALHVEHTSFRINSLDVAHMMMLFKIARMQGQEPSRDNYRDTAGYSSIAADDLLKNK